MAAGALIPADFRAGGRRSERLALDAFLDAVRAGESRSLVIRGEPGMGKTALLDYVADQASAFIVVRGGGVESEMELAFAVLHRLLAPMLDRLDVCRSLRLTRCGPPSGSPRLWPLIAFWSVSPC